MLNNQNGLIKSKIIMLSLLIVILIVGLLYVTGVYPAPESTLTVGSIGGAERAERYRNPDTDIIELDENEVNMFFQSAEWQNISKDPKLLETFMNNDLMEIIRVANSVQQFFGVYNSLENHAKANNIQTQEQFNGFVLNNFPPPFNPSISDWMNNIPVEQAIYVTNLMENGQLENLKEILSLINAWNLAENQKFGRVLNFACFNALNSNDIEKFSSTDFENFNTGFTSVILNSETGMNLVNAINSHSFMDGFLLSLFKNSDKFGMVGAPMNQDIVEFLTHNSELQYRVMEWINNIEMQYSISEFINNTDISNIINSNIFSRIIASNQDFRSLLEVIRP